MKWRSKKGKKDPTSGMIRTSSKMEIKARGMKTFFRRLAAGLSVLLAVFVLAGCWDRLEINDLAIVLVTAIDVGENENEFRLSVQIPLAGNMGGVTGGGGGSGEGKPYYIDSATGANLRECAERIQTRLSRRLFFSHRRIYLVGEQLAQQGIRELYDIYARGAENRLNAFLVVVEGRAVDYLTQDTKVERFSAEFIRELVKMNAPAAMNMKDAANVLASGFTDPVLPYLQISAHDTGKEKLEQVKLKGYAQFQGDRMIDAFRGDEAIGLMWLTRFNTYDDTFKNGNFLFAVRLNQGRIHIQPQLTDGRPVFRVTANAEATLLEFRGAREVNEPPVTSQIEDTISQQIKRQILAALEKMQKNKTDNAGFGFELYRRYPLIWKRDFEARWRERIPEAQFIVTVDCELEEVGFTSQNFMH